MIKQLLIAGLLVHGASVYGMGMKASVEAAYFHSAEVRDGTARMSKKNKSYFQNKGLDLAYSLKKNEESKQRESTPFRKFLLEAYEREQRLKCERKEAQKLEQRRIKVENRMKEVREEHKKKRQRTHY